MREAQVTYEEALGGLGRIVIYDDGHGTREEGTLVGVSYQYGMGVPSAARVRYSHNDASIKSTPLDKLTFLGGEL